MAAPYKEVLDAQCSSAMQTAYAGIGPEARILLLESLRSVCEGRLIAALRACADEPGLRLEDLAAPPSSGGDAAAAADSPVARAFRATCSSPLAQLHPPAAAVRELEAFLLAGWGVRRGVEAVLAEGEEVRRRIAQLEQGGGGSGGAVAVKASDSTVRKSTGGGGLSMAALRRLRRVGVRELVPFTTMRGARFEGVILAPPAGMVGLQVVVRDGAGDHLELGLYNQMERPDAALAAKLFPVGATLCVVEPFLKVFRSGAVGVRVDSSAEALVYPADWKEEEGDGGQAEGAEASALGAALRRAVELTADPRATFEAFVKALHVGGGGEASALGTVLSNAAQGYLCLGRHGEAAAAAAAALFVAPTDPAAAGESKALHRYCKAVAAIEDGDGCFECLLELGKVGVRGGGGGGGGGVGATGLDARKAEGNALFKKGAHGAAVAAYLAGVRETPWAADLAAACAQFCRACARLRLRDHVLASWGVVACAAAAGVDGAPALLRDVSVEAAAACIAMGDTAVLAPGLVALCDGGGGGGDAAAAAAALRRLAKVATPPARGSHPFSAAALRYNEAAEAMELQAGAALGPRVSALAALPQWTGSLSVRNVRGRGRGVFAAAAVAAGDVLMVDGAVVRHAADAAAEGELTVTTSTADSKASDSAMVRAYTSLYFRQLHDRYCRRAALFLHDGEDAHGYDRDVLQPADCVDHLFAASAGDKPRARRLHRTNRARPLLCFERGTPREAAAADAVTQTRLQRILRLNGFGSGDGGDGKRTLGLYPAISMLNHNLENNASLVPAKWEGGGEEVGLLLIAVRNIAAGDEVTIQYSNDPVLLKEKWGIVEG